MKKIWERNGKGNGKENRKINDNSLEKNSEASTLEKFLYNSKQ